MKDQGDRDNDIRKLFGVVVAAGMLPLAVVMAGNTVIQFTVGRQARFRVMEIHGLVIDTVCL